MPDTPSIPPSDPVIEEITAQVRMFTELATLALHQVADLAERIGKVTDRFDEITDDLDDAAIDHLREITGYDRLLSTMSEITAHAAAGANDPSVGSLPEWYQQQTARRRARWAVA